MSVEFGFGIDFGELWIGVAWYRCTGRGLHVRVCPLPCLVLLLDVHL